MNKQILKQVGITEEDYKLWCKQNNKVHYKKETKEEFFRLIQNNEIVKDWDGSLVKGKKNND